MKSMTGFGRGRYQDQYAVTVEARSVNHRFLDIRVKTSSALSFLVPEIQRRVSDFLSRGSVEIILQAISLKADDRRVRINTPLALQYRRALEEFKKAHSVQGETDLALLATFREIFEIEPVPESEGILREHVFAALEKALAALDLERSREGEATYNSLKQMVGDLKTIAVSIRDQVPAVREAKRQVLREKVTKALKDLEIDPDRGRLEEEVLYYIERADIEEELVRLLAHLDRLEALLSSEGRVGREMDFICQEINRELNTIGSKGNHTELSSLVVEGKAILEQVREQVQNVE